MARRSPRRRDVTLVRPTTANDNGHDLRAFIDRPRFPSNAAVWPRATDAFAAAPFCRQASLPVPVPTAVSRRWRQQCRRGHRENTRDGEKWKKKKNDQQYRRTVRRNAAKEMSLRGRRIDLFFLFLFIVRTGGARTRLLNVKMSSVSYTDGRGTLAKKRRSKMQLTFWQIWHNFRQLVFADQIFRNIARWKSLISFKTVGSFWFMKLPDLLVFYEVLSPHSSHWN